MLGDAYKERIDIIRINQDLTEELIKVSNRTFGSDLLNDLQLQSLDKITIYSKLRWLTINMSLYMDMLKCLDNIP